MKTRLCQLPIQIFYEEQQSYQQAQGQAELLNQQEQQRIINQWLEGQARLNAQIEQLESQGATAEQIAALREQGASQGLGVAINNASTQSAKLMQEYLTRKAEEIALAEMTEQERWEAYVNSPEYIARQESLAAWQAEQVYQDFREGEWADSPTMVETSWWDSAWNWTYNNQTELSFGTGVAIGAIAAIGIVAGVITAPAWLVIGGVALLTAGIIAGGTLAINNHFGLPPSTNLVDNIITGVLPAVTLTGIGCLIAFAAPLVTTTITTACANNPTACSYVGPIIDFGEQAIIATQMAYYGLINDQENLAITTVEWQMEMNDGGLPGNTLANETSQQITKLGPDALELIGQYGDEAIPLLLKHGNDAVDIIGAYGDEGISLLTLYGDDAVNLITIHGTPAVNLMLDYGDDAIDLYHLGDLPVSSITEIIPDDYYDEVINAFDGTPSAITLNEDVIVYRYWSGSGETEVGHWVALDSNLPPEQARQLFALPDSNLAINVTEFIIPADTTIIFGRAAEQTSSSWAGSYATGGGLQIYIPDSSVLVSSH